MKTDDFDLRFDNRVLAIHAFVNTDRDPGPLSMQIQRAAKGPRLDASCMWVEGYSDHGVEKWAEMCGERNIENNFTLRYDGKVLAFHTYVNTDADAYHIHKAVLRIVRGPRLDACVCWIELFEGEDGVKVWEVISKMAVKAAANPNAKPFTLAEEP